MYFLFTLSNFPLNISVTHFQGTLFSYDPFIIKQYVF